MKPFPRIILLLVTGLLMASSIKAELSPQSILEACDRARGNLEGVIWTVSVEARERGKQNARQLLVKSRGFDTVAEVLAPPQQKGHLLVMVKGNMWFYKPDISKPVPVSQRQKLLGLATNGDIASTNYSQDYEVLNWEETTLEDQDCYLFDLSAKNQRATYSRIKYWVTKRPLVGIKAEFYTADGSRLLKSARMSYDNQITMTTGKQPFITRMVIRDELMSDDVTTLSFANPVLQPLPDHLFNLNLLRK